MINKLKINYRDIVIFFISLFFCLLTFSKENKQFLSQVLITFPEVPFIYIDKIRNSRDFQINLNFKNREFLPKHFNDFHTMKSDSSFAKLDYYCEDLQVKIYDSNLLPTYISFKMDGQSSEEIELCYLRLKDKYNSEFEIIKEEQIFFLNKELHSLSEFSHLLVSKYDFSNEFPNQVWDCQNFYQIPNKYISLKNIFYNICGNYIDLVLVEKTKNVEIPIDKDVLLKINEDFKKRGYQKYLINEKISINIFKKEYSDLEIFFDEENINDDFIKILNLLKVQYFENLVKVLDTNLFFDLRKSKIDFNLNEFFKLITNNHFIQKKEIIDDVKTTIINLHLETKKKILVPETYKNVKLDFKKSKNYLLSSSKSLYSLYNIALSLILAIFISLIFKLLVSYFKFYKL